MDGEELWITKGQKQTLGYDKIHYHTCGDSMMGPVPIAKFIKLCTLNVCNLTTLE